MKIKIEIISDNGKISIEETGKFKDIQDAIKYLEQLKERRLDEV